MSYPDVYILNMYIFIIMIEYYGIILDWLKMLIV